MTARAAESNVIWMGNELHGIWGSFYCSSGEVVHLPMHKTHSTTDFLQAVKFDFNFEVNPAEVPIPASMSGLTRATRPYALIPSGFSIGTVDTLTLLRIFLSRFDYGAASAVGQRVVVRCAR